MPRGYARNRPLRADIAQLVEQRIRNAKVVGSTPIIGTIQASLKVYSSPPEPLYSRFKPFLIFFEVLRSTPESTSFFGVYPGGFAVRSKGYTPNEAKRSTGRDR